ncbi:vacuolar protein sorting-associated protein 13D [Caerostris extrusa]|uniref:Vacuolar protein sorting-associated protein 13D n=1 Tax=Caerostris extrusa TaxID=172846 RepID=A0AAV4TRB3_CAEEX|nr:vacuolar protein sorting-associated protein 13D [Caerostris extrusa]
MDITDTVKSDQPEVDELKSHLGMNKIIMTIQLECNVKKEILDVLDSADNSLLKRDTVFAQLNFSLSQGTFSLLQSDSLMAISPTERNSSKQTKSIIDLEFSDVSTKLETRPRNGSFLFEIKLGALYLHDRMYSDSHFPHIIAPQNRVYSKGWNIDMNISAPQIIIPEDICDKNSSVVTKVIFYLKNFYYTMFHSQELIEQARKANELMEMMSNQSDAQMLKEHIYEKVNALQTCFDVLNSPIMYKSVGQTKHFYSREDSFELIEQFNEKSSKEKKKLISKEISESHADLNENSLLLLMEFCIDQMSFDVQSRVWTAKVAVYETVNPNSPASPGSPDAINEPSRKWYSSLNVPKTEQYASDALITVEFNWIESPSSEANCTEVLQIGIVQFNNLDVIGTIIEIQGSLGGLQVLDLITENTKHQKIISIGYDPLTVQPVNLLNLLEEDMYKSLNNPPPSEPHYALTLPSLEETKLNHIVFKIKNSRLS